MKRKEKGVSKMNEIVSVVFALVLLAALVFAILKKM